MESKGGWTHILFLEVGTDRAEDFWGPNDDVKTNSTKYFARIADPSLVHLSLARGKSDYMPPR